MSVKKCFQALTASDDGPGTFDVSGVDQTGLDAVLFQKLIKRDRPRHKICSREATLTRKASFSAYDAISLSS
jgi:hypothetical protein